MTSDSENYTAGRSGVGGVNYASSAWRAGDLERARIQRENAEAMNQASVGGTSTSSNGTYSGSSGGGFTFFSILAFVVAGFYGIAEGVEYFVPNIEQEILPYIGPDGMVSKNVFFWTLAAILTIIGVFIRRILRWVLGIGLAAAIIGGIASLLIS